MDTAKEKPASDMTDRCRGALWGQFIGDAACAGIELIDQDELKRKYPQGVPLFAQPSAESREKGLLLTGAEPDSTQYGDAALLLLQSVAELGYFTAADFGPRFIACFSAEDYEGHLDSATKGTLGKYRAYTDTRPGASYHFQGGADDDHAATVTRLAPVVVNLCRQGSLLKVVESATRVCQDNQRAVEYSKCHALITREILTGSQLRDAVKSAAKAVNGDGEYGKEISNAVEEILSALPYEKEVREVTRKFGQGSQLTSCFPAALYCALKYEGDFRRAIQETADAGGDCAARAAMIGTWLGGLHGMQGIPAEWRDRIKKRDEIGRCIEKIVAKVGK